MIVDVCANLNHRHFSHDYREVILRARQAGIEPLLCVTDLNSLHLCEKLAREFNCNFTSGCHPHHARLFDSEKEHYIKALKNPLCLFVGETGLDFNRNYSTPLEQTVCFERQLEFHKECEKPLLLHDREASETMLRLLDKHEATHGILHCATASSDIINEYLSRGFFIGFTPWIMDPRRGGEALASMVATPLNKLLIESDCPFLPIWENGKRKYQRSEPAHLVEFLPFIAKKRNISQETLINALEDNFNSVIRR